MRKVSSQKLCVLDEQFAALDRSNLPSAYATTMLDTQDNSKFIWEYSNNKLEEKNQQIYLFSDRVEAAAEDKLRKRAHFDLDRKKDMADLRKIVMNPLQNRVWRLYFS
jgi:hypothetical protein